MPLEVSAEFEAKYISSKRSPAELFTLWNDFNTYYLTSNGNEIEYNGNTFLPARISRTNTERSLDLSITSINVTVNYLNEETVSYLTSAPIDQSWIRIEKVFLDQSPMESIIIFVGIIDKVSFKGQNATIKASGIEKLLRSPYPIIRYQPRCGLTLYSEMCGVDKASYVETRTVISVSSDGLTVLVNGTAREDDYFALGYIYSSEFSSRMIVSNTGNTLSLRSGTPVLGAGDTVTMYPGCSKKPSVCQSKFNNLGNSSLNSFLGFIYIPNDNPATWIS